MVEARKQNLLLQYTCHRRVVKQRRTHYRKRINHVRDTLRVVNGVIATQQQSGDGMKRAEHYVGLTARLIDQTVRRLITKSGVCR